MRRTNGSGYDWYPVIRACSYIALIIAGILIFILNLLPIIGIEIHGKILGALELAKNITLLVGIGFGAYAFTRGKKIWVAVLFWIALVLYIASVILGMF
ncbi:MAG: hypothetical protein K2L02_02525 [Clostridia bacterium]|nr:hypothetical protein [Clostridia bacterium]